MKENNINIVDLTGAFDKSPSLKEVKEYVNALAGAGGAMPDAYSGRRFLEEVLKIYTPKKN